MIIEGNALIAQGGGPTAVINQSLVGAILEMKKYSNIKKIFGAVFGIKGIINENFLNLSLENLINLEKVAKTPSSALFSTRDKPDDNYCKKILKVFKKYNIRYFFYIGGNDSADTVRIISNYATKEKYDFKTFHIPKTIDNDLNISDHTPGYGSAAQFVAEAFLGINFEIKSLPGIYLGIVMGRNSGFLTAASVLYKRFLEDGPHLVYLPERNFCIKKFLSDIKKFYIKYGFCIAAISEGICDKNGKPILLKFKKNIIKDAHGNFELSGGKLGEMLVEKIKTNLNISRVRSDTFGYLQRSFIASISKRDSLEARQVGSKAVFYAMKSKYKSGSIVINRISNKEYKIKYSCVDIKNIAKKTKKMPDEFINKEGNNITKKFFNYAMPLINNKFNKTSKLNTIKIKKIV